MEEEDDDAELERRTLRYGSMDCSVEVKELSTRYNLTFFDLRESAALFATLDLLLSSTTGIFAVPTLRQDGSQKRPFRPSRDPPRPREDTPELWHVRAGHLGAAALEALAYNARNVRIKGIPRIKCEACAQNLQHQEHLSRSWAYSRSSPILGVPGSVRLRRRI